MKIPYGSLILFARNQAEFALMQALYDNTQIEKTTVANLVDLAPLIQSNEVIGVFLLTSVPSQPSWFTFFESVAGRTRIGGVQDTNNADVVSAEALPNGGNFAMHTPVMFGVTSLEAADIIVAAATNVPSLPECFDNLTTAINVLRATRWATAADVARYDAIIWDT